MCRNMTTVSRPQLRSEFLAANPADHYIHAMELLVLRVLTALHQLLRRQIALQDFLSNLLDGTAAQPVEFGCVFDALERRTRILLEIYVLA
jgi:hypothetical protein